MISIRWSVTTRPTQEPLTLAEVQDHLRIDGTDEQSVIDALIIAARQYCESLTGRAMLTQTITAYYPGWPKAGSALLLPRAAPLQSVTSVAYYDTFGVLQTLSSGVYDVQIVPEPGEITLTYGDSWPSYRDQVDPIKVVFVAGWSSRGLIPESLRQAMLLLIGHWYNNRESSTMLTLTNTPTAFDALIGNYRVGWF